MVLLAKHDGFPARRLEARVDALRFYTDLIEKILIALNVRAARGTDLHESQPLLVSGIDLEKTLQGAEALEDSLGVVNAIDTHAEERRFGALHFFQNDIRKPPVDSLILHPVLRTKDGTRMRNVRERPQSFIRKPLVVALVFFVGEPHAPQGITRMIGRNTQMIANIHHFAVSVA